MFAPHNIFKFLYSTGILTLFSMLLSCNNNIGSSDNKLHSNLSPANQLQNNILWQQHQSIHDNYLKNTMEPPILMGHGLDNRTGIDTGVNCMANYNDPSAVTISNPRATIDFSGTTDSDTVAELINTGLSGKANFGLYSASIAAKYARSSSNSRQSLHFNYLQTMAADASYIVPSLGNNALRPEAKDLLVNGGGMDTFSQVCGNSFIQSANRGAVLLVDVAIEFANADSKNEFAANTNVKAMGIGGIALAFSKNVNISTAKATLVVKAMQLGGDATKLALIFGKSGDDGNYNVINCTAQDITGCNKIISEVVYYAQNTLANSVDFKKSDTLYTFSYVDTPYKKIGIKAELPALTLVEQKANAYIADSIIQDRKMLDYLQSYQRQIYHYYNSSYETSSLMMLLKPQTVDLMNQAITDYGSMIHEYDKYDIIDACYGDTLDLEHRCLLAADHIKNLHDKYAQIIKFANLMATAFINDFGGDRNHDFYKLIPTDMNNVCYPSTSPFKQDFMQCRGRFVGYSLNNRIFDKTCTSSEDNTMRCQRDIIDDYSVPLNPVNQLGWPVYDGDYSDYTTFLHNPI